MDRELLPHLPALLAVARTRSFARAASELGLGAPAVSHSVRFIEKRIGAPLFARTTRSVGLTEAGEVFVEAARRAFDDMDGAIERVKEGQRAVTGRLRINAPRVALYMGLTSVLAEMSRLHPALTIEVVTDDALSDVVGLGFDAGIRLGEMIAQDMVAVRLTPPCRAIMVASPDYLARRPAPASLGALAHHNCIGYRLLASGKIYAWDLQQNGKDVQVPVQGTVCVSDPIYARDLALAGIGIAYLFEPLVAADLSADRLRQLLPEASIEEPGLFLYFPKRAAEARKLRALIEMVRQRTR